MNNKIKALGKATAAGVLAFSSFGANTFAANKQAKSNIKVNTSNNTSNNKKRERLNLIKELNRRLLKELPNCSHMPKGVKSDDIDAQRNLLRNLTYAWPENKPLDAGILKLQDKLLLAELQEKKIVDAMKLPKTKVPDVYLWQGDITTLKVDAIVNAARSSLTGCWSAGCGCIDRAIHSAAGFRLREACKKIKAKYQIHNEPVGQAKITLGYNLPCKKVIHTVGPSPAGKLTQKDRRLLASCYNSCLKLADKNKLKSIAFSCISTGAFGFPNDEASKIAVDTVKKYKAQTKSKIKVIFNVFKDQDLALYKDRLSKDEPASTKKSTTRKKAAATKKSATRKRAAATKKTVMRKKSNSYKKTNYQY